MDMPTAAIIVSLISCMGGIFAFIGSVLIAILGYLFARPKNNADARHANSQALKTDIESIDKLEDIVEKLKLAEVRKFEDIQKQLDKQETEDLRLKLQFEIETEKNQLEYQKLLLEVESSKVAGEKLRLEAEKSKLEAEKLRAEAIELQESRNYKNYRIAFEKLEEYIELYLEDYLQHGMDKPVVTLKLIAVSMTFSWDFFITTSIPTILDSFPSTKINMEVLFVDYQHLGQANIGKYDVDWVKTSKVRLAQVKDFANKCKKYNGRLIFKAKTYRNIPHWHGWLLNGEHLFLGRTDWAFDKDNQRPELRVGQNEYRHFDTTSAEGARRIDLFQRWQKYYFQFANDSTLICDSENLGS